MDPNEVSKTLNISVETVKAIEFKALRKLRTEFLKIENKKFWEEIVSNSREKDPTEYYYDKPFDQ